jgi:hypothetical protein
MNEDLPSVTPLSESRQKQLRNRLEVGDCLRGLSPGRYTTAMLYPRYLAWAEREGVKPLKLPGLAHAMRALAGPAVEKLPSKHSVWELSRQHVS